MQADRDGVNCRAQGVGPEQSCQMLKPTHQQRGLTLVRLLAAALKMA